MRVQRGHLTDETGRGGTANQQTIAQQIRRDGSGVTMWIANITPPKPKQGSPSMERGRKRERIKREERRRR